MEEVNKKITKIVVSREDELTDIVSGILDSSNERIVLTFAEESDLLISPVNLKVILDTADEQEKVLVAQIIKNDTGVRNATLAGLTTVETTNLPAEDVWEKEAENKVARMSQKDTPVEGSKKLTKEEDTGINIDDDIPIVYEDPKRKVPDFSTKDFNSPDIKEKIIPATAIPERKEKNIAMPKFSSKTKNLLILGVAGLFLILGLAAFIYYKTSPLVRIRIYIEAKDLEITKEFVGDANIKEVNFDEGKVPIKKEKVEKARSSTIKATGIAFKGEKAKGKVAITYKKDDCTNVNPINLPAGQSVTSSGGKGFKLDAAVSVGCNSISQGNITAIEVGEEYNLSMGTSFTLQGYSSSEVYALSSYEALTGGTKQQYTVLSQADVNTGVEALKKIAVEEGEQELKDKSGGDWEMITTSIKSDVVKDSIKTDIAVGAEGNETTLNLKTVSEATYFLKEGFDEKVGELLTKEAQAKNLFETDKNMELTLGNDVQKDITVVENTAESTRIKLVAKAKIKPKVEKDKIIEELGGKGWNEGNDILKKYVFSDKETEVDFEPKNFPEKLKYFPSRRGGTLIEIKEVL